MAALLDLTKLANLNKLKDTIVQLKKSRTVQQVNVGDLIVSISPLIVTTSAAAESSNKIVVTAQLKDTAGRNLTSAVNVTVKLIGSGNASFALSDDGAGSLVGTNTGTDEAIFTTDATGALVFGVTDTAAETVIVAIGGGAGCSRVIEGTTLSLTFA